MQTKPQDVIAWMKEMLWLKLPQNKPPNIGVNVPQRTRQEGAVYWIRNTGFKFDDTSLQAMINQCYLNLNKASNHWLLEQVKTFIASNQKIFCDIWFNPTTKQTEMASENNSDYANQGWVLVTRLEVIECLFGHRLTQQVMEEH